MKGQEQLSDSERFFSTARRDPDLCAYGPEHVHQALQMYAVEELMVSETGRPGDLDILAWTALAANHKVPIINIVKQDSSAGKRFCNGVGVGGLLRRPMEFVMDSPVCINVTTALPDAFCLQVESGNLQKPPITELPLLLSSTSSFTSLCLPQQDPHCEFFEWLWHALSKEADAATAMCLFDGVYVILTDDFLGEYEFQEALASACDILAAEAPQCALEVSNVWCATHLDQDLTIHACFPDQHEAISEAVCPRAVAEVDTGKPEYVEQGSSAAFSQCCVVAAHISACGDHHSAPMLAAPAHSQLTQTASHGYRGTVAVAVPPHMATLLAIDALGRGFLQISFLLHLCERSLVHMAACYTVALARPPPEPPPQVA